METCWRTFFPPLFKGLPAGESPEGWLKERIMRNYLEKQSGTLTPVTKRAIHNIQEDALEDPLPHLIPPPQS